LNLRPPKGRRKEEGGKKIEGEEEEKGTLLQVGVNQSEFIIAGVSVPISREI
jgi:hypothetical protein